MAAQGLVFDAIFGSNHLVTIPSQSYLTLQASYCRYRTPRLRYVCMRVTCQGGKMTWVRLGWPGLTRIVIDVSEIRVDLQLSTPENPTAKNNKIRPS